jgi:hypothetical protein
VVVRPTAFFEVVAVLTLRRETTVRVEALKDAVSQPTRAIERQIAAVLLDLGTIRAPNGHDLIGAECTVGKYDGLLGDEFKAKTLW